MTCVVPFTFNKRKCSAANEYKRRCSAVNSSILSHQADQAAEIADKAGACGSGSEDKLYKGKIDSEESQEKPDDKAEGCPADAPEQNPFDEIFYVGFIHLSSF